MFIAVEGPEGCGKSTLTERLAAHYRRRGLEVLVSREPGGTPVGEEFRRVLKDPRYQGKFPPLAELFGFLAARAAFVHDVVKPALDEGKLVLTDRFSLSTMAYQIAGRGLPEAECLAAIRLAEGGVRPIYIVLHVSPETGLNRKRKQGDSGDRFAQENLDYHRRVAEGYFLYVAQSGSVAVEINAELLNPEEVFRQAVDGLRGFDRELGA